MYRERYQMCFFFFSSRRRHTRLQGDWSSDVCSSDLYFGGWAAIDEAWDLALDPIALKASRRAFGCGVVSFLAADACGVKTTARIMDYMAGQSAAQCGPCVFGLRAIADVTRRIGDGAADTDHLAR